jgi:hypothetical protein
MQLPRSYALCVRYISFPFSHFSSFLTAKHKDSIEDFFKRQRYSEISKIATGVFHLNSFVIRSVILPSSGGQ